MGHQPPDQLPPAGKLLWCGEYSAAHGAHIGVLRKQTGHIAQFQHGFCTQGEDKINPLVHLGKIQNRVTVHIQAQQAHVIIQDALDAQKRKADAFL